MFRSSLFKLTSVKYNMNYTAIACTNTNSILKPSLLLEASGPMINKSKLLEWLNNTSFRFLSHYPQELASAIILFLDLLTDFIAHATEPVYQCIINAEFGCNNAFALWFFCYIVSNFTSKVPKFRDIQVILA